MTPSQQHPKKRKAPPPSDAVLAGQEFYQQQLRKSLGGGAPPRRRRTTTSTGQTRALSTPAAAQLRHRQRRAAHWRASQNNNHNNHNNARSNNIHNEFDHEEDHEAEEEEEPNNDSSKDDGTLHDYAGSSNISPTTTATLNGGRAAKRARRHSPSPPPPQAEPAVAAAAAQPEPTTYSASSTAPATTPPSAPSSWKRTVLKPSPVQQGLDYYQAQMEKKTSPVVRVSEPPIIQAARSRPLLPLVPSSSDDRAAASTHKNTNSNSSSLRRHSQPNLELIPKESEESAITEDKDNDETSFLDAIEEPSSPPRGNENKKKLRTILGWVALVVSVPVLLAVALTTFSSSSSTSVSPLQLGWMWCQSVIPKTSLSWPQFGLSSSSISYRTPSGPPCFADSADIDASTDTDATTFALPHHCREVQSRTPCPPHAVCRGGLLQHCRHHHYLQSNGTACVLTPSARDTVHATRDLLAKYSVHVLCGSSSKQRYHPLFHQYDNGEGGVPLFRYRPLVETYLQTPYEPELLELANEEKLIFVLRTTTATSTTTPEDQQDDSLLLVGLHPQYPLDIPLRCTLRKYVGMSTQLVGAVLLGVLGILGSYLWDSLVTAPLQTIVLVGGGSMLLWWIGGIRRRNRAKRQRDLDIVNLRHAAHIQLQQSGGGTAAPHLRDALAWEWYPTNRAQRQYLQHQLWPCVVQDLCSDSRVECRYENGELIWQWRAAAAAALPKPRVQFGSAEPGRTSY